MTDRRAEFDVPADADDLDAVDAFSLLGNPIRLDVVRALWQAGRGNPLSFAELYDRVDVSDSAKFDYHRDQLVPQYVRRSEDGYRLTQAGERVARAVNAGTYSEYVELPEFDVPGACYDCGARSLRGEYVGERFRIDCRDCENRVLNVGVPPSAARGRNPAEFVDAYETWARTRVESAREGVCPNCTGPVEPGTSEPIRDTLDVDVQAVFDCTVCDRRVVSSFGTLALWHDAVESFLDDRDSELVDEPYWSVEHALTDRHTERLAEEPGQYRVRFEVADDVCTVEFDEALKVVGVSVA